MVRVAVDFDDAGEAAPLPGRHQQIVGPKMGVFGRHAALGEQGQGDSNLTDEKRCVGHNTLRSS